MLALKISNPVVEQYFHNDPKEASDLLEAIATRRVMLIALNEQNEPASKISKLRELQELMNFNSAKAIKVPKNINISASADEIND